MLQTGYETPDFFHMRGTYPIARKVAVHGRQQPMKGGSNYGGNAVAQLRRSLDLSQKPSCAARLLPHRGNPDKSGDARRKKCITLATVKSESLPRSEMLGNTSVGFLDVD